MTHAAAHSQKRMFREQQQGALADEDSKPHEAHAPLLIMIELLPIRSAYRHLLGWILL